MKLRDICFKPQSDSSIMTDQYNMEGHKLLWHLDRVNSWLKGERIAPVLLDISINQTCNASCRFCYYAVSDNKKANVIPTDALLRLIQDCAEIGVKAIVFGGDGEATLHPGIYDVVNAGAEAGLDMSMMTNGISMKEGRLKDFLASMTWIKFNICAATPQKYALVMGTTERLYHKAYNNIKKCVEIKKKYNLKITIGIQMLLIHDCVDEIVSFARMGKELGVDYTVIKQCSESDGIKLKLIGNDIEPYLPLFDEAKSYSDDKYSVIVKTKKMQMFKRNYGQCFGCEFLATIDGAGNYQNCGNFYYTKDFHIGNIINDSFKMLVFSDRQKEVLNRVSNELDVHSQCGQKCRQNEINEFLWKLKSPPDHINFI